MRHRHKHKAARRPHPGSQPGVLAVPKGAPPPRITILHYAIDRLEEAEVQGVGQIRPFLERTDGVTWVDIQGLGDETVLTALGQLFKLHRLALADVVNVPQRPKVEPYDDHLFIVTRMTLLTPDKTPHSEQVSLFLGKGFVLTFQETYGDCLDPVRERLRKSTGSIRRSGPDYLAYAILDAIADHYFPVVESLGERIERLEDQVMSRATPQTLRSIYSVKRDLLAVRRAIWPQREAIQSLLHDDTAWISQDVKLYFRDCYDHILQVIEIVESSRELAASLLDAYLSFMANRTNEVMRLLTVVTAIFIPLTFIVGIYGMNFQNMPEMSWEYGYPAVWTVMGVIATLLLYYFKRKGWLSYPDLPEDASNDAHEERHEK